MLKESRKCFMDKATVATMLNATLANVLSDAELNAILREAAC